MVHTFGWPIGIVLQDLEDRPKPTNEGILAKVLSSPGLLGPSFDYWTLSRGGDFYTIMSLFEDERDPEHPGKIIYFDTRISRTTEALLHSANLYKLLGLDPDR